MPNLNNMPMDWSGKKPKIIPTMPLLIEIIDIALSELKTETEKSFNIDTYIASMHILNSITREIDTAHGILARKMIAMDNQTEKLSCKNNNI